MLVKVLKTTKASKNESGTQIFEYLEGEIYDIYDNLAEIFIKEGWGEKAIDNLENKKDIIEEKAIEEKAIEELENKAIDNLENKDIKTKKGNRNAK